MTIATQTSKTSFAGNGVTTSFPLPFPFQREADIKAVLRREDADIPLSQGTHYALAGAGNAAGGTLTMLIPPATGETLVIWRAPAIVQEVDYVENASFPAETHEAALDLLTMICQSLQEQIDRAVLYPVSTPDGDVLDSTSFLKTAAASRDAARQSAIDAAGSAGQADKSADAASADARRAENAADAAAHVAATADSLVKVSPTDAAGGSLTAKLSAGDGLSETLLDAGATESLRLSVALAESSGLEFASGRLRVLPGPELRLSPSGLGVDPAGLAQLPILRPVISTARILNHAINGGF